jgi:tetratricopeptide (TPR) repeat protein
MFGKKRKSGRAGQKGKGVGLQDSEGFGFLILANGYRKAKRYDEALEVCRAGLESHPDYLSARVALAMILIERGDREEAQSELEIILEASPTNLIARQALGNLYREDQNLKDAKLQFEELLWLLPGNTETLDTLVSLDEELAEGGMGRKGGSESSVETLPPENAEVEEGGPPPEAEDAGTAEEPASEVEIPVALESSPFPELAGMEMSDPQYTPTLARLYEGQGNLKAALVTYRMVLKDKPDDKTIPVKIQELEQAIAFEQELAESGVQVDSVSSVEEESAQESEEAVLDDGEPDPALELLDLEEKGVADDASPGAGPALEDIAGDREPSPAEPETGSVDADGPAEVPTGFAEAVPEEEPFPGELEDLLVSEAESPPESESPLPPLEDELETSEADSLTDLDDVASDADEEPDALAADPVVADPVGAVEQEAPPPEETRAESPPASGSGQEATIERLEGLLDRIRAKPKEGEDS